MVKSLFENWIFLSFLAVALLIIFYQFYKLVLAKPINDSLPPVIFPLIGAVMIMFLIPLFEWKIPNDPKVYLIFLGSALFYAIHDRLQATVRRNLDISVATVIDTSVYVYTILFGIILFKESLLVTKFVGAGLILFANILVVYDFKKRKFNKYWFLGLIANLAYATGIAIDVGISKQFNLPFYLFISYLMPVGIIWLKNREEVSLNLIKKELFSDRFWAYIITGFGSVFYTFTMLLAAQHGEVSKVTTIIASSAVLNVFVSYFVLKEQENMHLKIVAAVLAFIGVIIII